MAITAPSAAPLETPRVNGAAKSFRRRDWNTAPATESAAPVRAARKILGTRARNRMLASTLSLNGMSFERAFPKSISVGPIIGVISRIARNNKKNKPMVVT